MNRAKRGMRWWWLVLVALMVAGPAWAGITVEPKPGDVIESDGDLTRNWTQRVFVVRGYGAPPGWATSRAQARILAEEAARANAQAKLLEAMLGTRIDAHSYFRNAVAVNTELEKVVKGELRHAFETGVRELDDGRVEVSLGIWIRGDLANALLGQVPSPPRLAATPPPPPPTPTVATPPPAKPPVIYTGLVVDARGLAVRPAMAPRIVSEAGQEIFGSAIVDRTWAVQQGMAGYSKDLSAAQANERVADRPLTVKGLKADGPNRSDIIISNADAQVLLGAAQHLSFLEKARIVIVVD